MCLTFKSARLCRRLAACPQHISLCKNTTLFYIYNTFQKIFVNNLLLVFFIAFFVLLSLYLRNNDKTKCAYYNLSILFKSAWETLLWFWKNKGINPAMIVVLHTWEQNLNLHPHLHCIVTGGAFNCVFIVRAAHKQRKRIYYLLCILSLFYCEQLNH